MAPLQIPDQPVPASLEDRRRRHEVEARRLVETKERRRAIVILSGERGGAESENNTDRSAISDRSRTGHGKQYRIALLRLQITTGRQVHPYRLARM